MNKFLFISLWVIGIQCIGYSSEEENNLNWNLSTYKDLKRLQDVVGAKEERPTLGSTIQQDFYNFSDAFPVDEENSIYAKVVTLPTQNFFNLENHFLSQQYIVASPEGQRKSQDFFKGNQVVPQDTIFGFLFYRLDQKSTRIRLDLPCISRIGASKRGIETKHDELARCLRMSAIYTFITGHHCLLLNSFSRTHVHGGVLDPVHGATDLLLASQVLKDSYAQISYFGTSWGGIGVHLAHIDFYIKNILNQEKVRPLADHYSTINYMPVFQHAYEEHVNVPFVNIHGDRDGICDYEITKAYCELHGLDIVTFEDMGHNFHMFNEDEGQKQNIGCVPFEEVGIKFNEKLTREDADNFINRLSEKPEDVFQLKLMSARSLSSISNKKKDDLFSWLNLITYFSSIKKKNITYGNVESSYEISLSITKILYENGKENIDPSQGFNTYR